MKKKHISAKPDSDKIAKTKKSEKLEVCTTAPHAEMARTENKDEPCDDGREGK